MRQAASDRHSSRSAVARALKQPTRKAVAGPTAFPIWSCSERGMPSMPRRRGIWWALAPPFHPYPAPKSAGRPEKGLASFVPVWVRGGLLSVALSEGRPSWVLPSVLPCGARTFLSGRNGPQRRSVRLPHFLQRVVILSYRRSALQGMPFLQRVATWPRKGAAKGTSWRGIGLHNDIASIDGSSHFRRFFRHAEMLAPENKTLAVGATQNLLTTL